MGDHDLGRLDVPVADADLMSGVVGFGHLLCDRQDVVDRQRALRPQPGIDRDPGEILQ
jgi:hypothetical protein